MDSDTESVISWDSYDFHNKPKRDESHKVKQKVEEWIIRGDVSQPLELDFFRIKTMPTLPTNLKFLHITRCQLQTIPEIPPQLEELKIERIRDLQTLPPLPITLKSLHISDCNRLRITTYPDLLQHLNIEHIFEIPNTLPLHLKTVRLRQFGHKYEFHQLPPGLEELFMDDASELVLPKEFPATIKIISLNRCDGFHELPLLPEGLLSLDIHSIGSRYGDKKMIHLPPLPSTLEVFECSFIHIRTLPPLPFTLNRLKCEHSPLTTLPPLPPNLKELECSNTWLTTLPALPESLTWLVCKDCPLHTLPTLPNSLENMYVYHTNLTRLPRLPPKMKVLNISNTHIEVLPPLPRTLNVIGMEQTPLTLIRKQREPMSNYKRRWRNWWKRRESLQVEYGYVDT
jgi:E3 ubiquitin-protein ligase SspH2